MRLRAACILGILCLVSPAAPGQPEIETIERLAIRSHDGFELAARFHDGGERGGAVLLLHQCDREGVATGLEGLARGLAQRGIHAMEIDLRGYGESRSDVFDGRNWQEAREHNERDVEAVFRTLISLPEVDRERIGIIGASCGGRFAVQLARARSGIRALAFLSVGLSRSPSEFLDRVKQLPMLCIASEKDPYGSAAESMRVAFATSEHPSSKLILLKGNAHGAPLLEQEPGLESTIIDWLDERLN